MGCSLFAKPLTARFTAATFSAFLLLNSTQLDLPQHRWWVSLGPLASRSKGGGSSSVPWDFSWGGGSRNAPGLLALSLVVSSTPPGGWAACWADSEPPLRAWQLQTLTPGLLQQFPRSLSIIWQGLRIQWVQVPLGLAEPVCRGQDFETLIYGFWPKIKGWCKKSWVYFFFPAQRREEQSQRRLFQKKRKAFQKRCPALERSSRRGNPQQSPPALPPSQWDVTAAAAAANIHCTRTVPGPVQTVLQRLTCNQFLFHLLAV